MNLKTTVAVLAASTGIAVGVGSTLVPPGLGAGRPLELTTLVLTGGAFWRTWLLAAPALVLALVIAASRARRAARPDVDAGSDAATPIFAAAIPLLCGLAAPAAALLLDPWSFHRTAPTLAAAGVGLGALGTARSFRRQRPGDAERHVAGRFVALTMIAAVLVPTVLVLPGPPWFHPISGDEPHYLVIARSLWVDGDLDVRNEYDEALLAPFWPGELSAHAKPGADPEKQFSIHGSGLGVWLAPWFGVGRNLSEAAFNVLVRVAMSLWLAAGAAFLYLLLRDLGGTRAATRGTLIATFTLPLLFAGPHLFPAVPVCTLGIGAYWLIRRRPGLRGAMAAGLLLAPLPWLHFKFFGLMATLAAIGIFVQWRADSATRRWAPIAGLAVPVVLTSIAHIAFTRALYGRWSPLAIHLGADPTLRAPAAADDWLAYAADPLGVIVTGVGYFFDQREGLLFYAPQYLLAIAGIAWLRRRRPFDAGALALAFGALVVPYALSQEIGHWGPPARPLTGVLWTIAVPMGIGLVLPAGGGAVGRARTVVRVVLVGWGVAATTVLLSQADLLYHEFSVPRALVLLRYGAPKLPLADFAPVWLGPDAVRWLPSLLWLAPTLVAATLLWRWGDAASRDADAPALGVAPGGTLGFAIAAGFVLVAAGLSLVHHAVVPVSDLHQPWVYRGVRYWKPQSPPTRAWAAEAGIWAGGNDSIELLLSSPEPIGAIVFELSTLAPMRAEVQVGRDRQTLRLTPDQRTYGRFVPGPGRRWNDEYFYHLNVTAHGGTSPAALGRGDDGRGLGVLLEAVQLDAGVR